MNQTYPCRDCGASEVEADGDYCVSCTAEFDTLEYEAGDYDE